MFTTGHELKLLVLPGWIYRCINRNNLNIVDIHSYVKMRNILSIDDIAEWNYLNTRFNIRDSHLANMYLLDNFQDLTPEQKTEFTNSVHPLSGTENIAQAVSAKLNTYGVVGPTYYDFIVSNNIIYIILNEGFLSHISDTNSELEFIKNYLKQCYSMAPLANVSQLDIFKLYMLKLQ